MLTVLMLMQSVLAAPVCSLVAETLLEGNVPMSVGAAVPDSIADHVMPEHKCCPERSSVSANGCDCSAPLTVLPTLLLGLDVLSHKDFSIAPPVFVFPSPQDSLYRPPTV